ncbi:MAG: LLM class flavin-dependent oxidoreductase [Methylobacterium mesophilicum]|nr:LLM class flavin-dependent oxidoreductase [Methylobacterium mesophilicum]
MPTALALSGPFDTAPDNWTPASLLEIARAAESAGILFLVLPDAIAASDGTGAWPDASLLAGWLAASTASIGFLVAASTVGHQPYNLARRIASLDMISGGRSGWLVRTEDEENESEAFSGAARLPEGNTPKRIGEFVSVVRGLWDGWDADALLFDQEQGRFLDPAKMHPLDHQGRHFSVQGPLNVMRSPQDRPVLATRADAPAEIGADLTVSANGFALQGADGESRRLLVARSPAEARRHLADLAEDERISAPPPNGHTLRERLFSGKEAGA